MHPKAIRRLCAVVAGCACALAAQSASAQNKVVFDQPFENDGLPDIPYNYSYQSNGSATVTGNGIDNRGVGGSGGEFMFVDSSGVTNAIDPNDGHDLGFHYWGMGLGNFILTNQQPTSMNQSDYVWSGEVRAEGLVGSGATGRFQVQFQKPNPSGGNGIPLVELRSPDFTLIGAYSHYSSNLGGWTLADGSGPWSNFQDALRNGDTILGASVFLATDDYQSFGLDSGNGLQYDNLRLEQLAPVPEPAALAVLGAAGLIALGGRRRRS
jgi:hypothetical protein